MQTNLLIVTLLLCLGILLVPAAHAAEDAEKKLRVVVFGDSITGHRPGDVYQREYVKYTELLGLMIEAHIGLGKVEMINSGWSGDSTLPKEDKGWPGGRARLKKDLIDHKPDFAIFLFGGNNKPNTAERKAKLHEDLGAMITAVKEAGIPILMLQYHPAMPTEKNKNKGTYLLAKLTNPIIAEVAKKYNVPVLDMGPAMVAANKKYGEGFIVNNKDGVHLKPRGEVVFARTIFAKLLELGWLKTKE